MYRVGTKIRLVDSLDDELPRNGTIGEIIKVDFTEDQDAYLVAWADEYARNCWVYPEVDYIEPITEDEYNRAVAQVKAQDRQFDRYRY